MVKNEFPKISLVIPVFNGESFIERAFLSILDQNYPSLELIFMDGGSTDRTVEIADKYKDRFAHFQSQPDDGQTDAINQGFSHATGDVYGWLCADDTLTPGALQEVAELFRLHPECDMVIGASRRMFEDGFSYVVTPRKDVMARIHFHNGIEQPSTFWKKELHLKAAPLDQSMAIGMDWDWWNRLYRCGAKSVITEKVISHYFFPETSKTSAEAMPNLEAHLMVLRRYGPLDGKLADIFEEIFHQYDLAGCLDAPSIASKSITKRWKGIESFLRNSIGDEYMDVYRWCWHPMSLQHRGLTWFKPQSEQEYTTKGFRGQIELLTERLFRLGYWKNIFNPPKIVIFGTGVGGLSVFEILQRKRDIVAFADNDPNKQRTLVGGKNVISPEQLLSTDFDLVLIASMYHNEIRRQLQGLGIPHNRIIRMDVVPVHNSLHIQLKNIGLKTYPRTKAQRLHAYEILRYGDTVPLHRLSRKLLFIAIPLAVMIISICFFK